MKQSVQVSILGQQFHLKSDEPAAHVQRVARFVEDQIRQVTASGRAVDTLQAAILALLNVSAAHLSDEKSVAEQDDHVATELGQLIEKIEATLSE